MMAAGGFTARTDGLRKTLGYVMRYRAPAGPKSMVRVAGYSDRAGIQQRARPRVADGVLFLYQNPEKRGRRFSCHEISHGGTRSVYFRSAA